MKTPAKAGTKTPAAKKATPKKTSPKKTSPKKAALKKAAPKKAAPKKTPSRKAAAKAIVASRPVGPLPGRATRPEGLQPVAEAAVLDRLYAVITDRRTADPALSHSARLLSRGMDKVAQKFGEEAVECLIEAVAGRAEALVAESADVLYHLLVMWVAAGVQPDRVWAELARREGVSGIDEKAARPSPIGTTKIP